MSIEISITSVVRRCLVADEDVTIGELINPWTGMIEEEEESLEEGLQEEKEQSKPAASGRSSGSSMAFDDTCKLCEVLARLDNEKTEGMGSFFGFLFIFSKLN